MQEWSGPGPFVGRVPVPHEAQRVEGDLVGDAADTARLEQHHRPVTGRRLLHPRLEQGAFQMEEQRAVRVLAGRELDHLVRAGGQGIDGRAHGGQRRPAGLIRK